MNNIKSKKSEILSTINENGFCILHGNAIEKIKKIPDNSIKLFYGSPPYPNAKRNYKTWKIDNYIDEISPFIQNALPKLTDDGFIVINVKANRTNPKSNDESSERSLIIEELMLHMKKELRLYCVDIEIWIKSNPVPTGVRVACQDAYEYNLWFSKSSKWQINIDPIRREYSDSSLKTYQNTTFKPRKNGLQYVSKEKKITPNELGALPLNISNNEMSNLVFNLLPSDFRNDIINLNSNIVYGAVSGRSEDHQAVQPEYLPEKYILACTQENDIVLDPWVGSGTTGKVALKLKRKFIGIDISKEFSELATRNINEVKNEKIEKCEVDIDA